MKKVLILGASGNLGKYLVDYFCTTQSDKYEIIAAGRKKQFFCDNVGVAFAYVDITKPDTFSNIPNDLYAIIDCAGILPAKMEGYQPEKYFEVNTLGTLNILEFSRKHNVNKFLFTQTWADLNGYLKEDAPLEPYAIPKLIYTGDHAVYAISKNAAVDLIKHYNAQYGLNAYIFRLPNIYMYKKNSFYYLNGKKQQSSYRIMIDRAIRGESIELWGNPQKGKDIVYVKDFAQMIYNCVDVCNKSFGIYNVGTGVKTTMREQIEGIINVFCESKKSEIVLRPDKPDCVDFVMDIANAKEDLHYEPKFDYISYLKDFKREMNLDRF